jgi:transposase
LLSFARLEAGGFMRFLLSAKNSIRGSSQGGLARSAKHDAQWKEIEVAYLKKKQDSPSLTKHEICEQLGKQFDLETETLKNRLRCSGLAPKKRR